VGSFEQKFALASCTIFVLCSCYFHFDRERFTMGNGLNKPAFCYEISLPYRALVSESNSVDESLDEVEILFHIACRHDLIL
jgi:hypothetical protein